MAMVLLQERVVSFECLLIISSIVSGLHPIVLDSFLILVISLRFFALE